MAETSDKNNEGISFQLAKGSWCCPVIIVLLTVLGGRTGARLIIELVALVLMVSGISFGIVALFGIPKNGRKGILIPALIGIAVNSLFIFIFVTNFLAARARHGG